MLKRKSQLETEGNDVGGCGIRNRINYRHGPLTRHWHSVMYIRSVLQILVALAWATPVHSFYLFRICRPRTKDSASRVEFGADSTNVISRPQRSFHSALKYKNHREVQVDLDLKFALEDPNVTGGPFRVLVEYLRRFLYRLNVKLWQLKRAIRAATQKYTIYVLECENGKYYVGSTSHKRQRFRQHMAQGRGGAAWTRLHKPLRVAFQYKRVPGPYYLGMEAKMTAEWMLKYGINNVRGAMFCEVRDYTLVCLRGFG